jgi:large repetitive protein
MKPDGSAVVRLTYGVASSVWHPAWSPDGGRIAFNCQVESGNSDVCLINSDGTSFVRLTYDPASDAGTTWSPDGASIAFATTRYGPSWEIAVMNADGSGVHQVDAGVGGWNPAWSPDGAKIAFDGSGVDYRYSLIYTMSADGTNVAQFANGFQPAWMPARVPVATLTFVCNGTTCNFDASGSKDSYGTITSYAWSFGDQATGTGATVTHTYAGGSNYTVRLTVTDSNGATGTKFQTVTDVNSAPAATFNFSSNGLRCSFDGSGSRDSDGTIGSYVWNFGDGTTGSGARVSHTYAAFGQYTVTLTVTDNAGATNAHSQTVIANSPPVASFSFSCSKFTCSFDAAGSKDSDGVITSYAWDFGDGKTGSGPAVSHTYKAPPDTYTVTLTVTDNGGATGAQSASVTVVRRK